MNFDTILNWKLLSGSHEFPGPDGGTCINEAAIVAAGFEYKAINSPNDLPKCFSKPIARLAMTLNDFMPDDLRQGLMKYVCRLAGSADVFSVETRRSCLRDDILGAGVDDLMREIAREKQQIFYPVLKRYQQTKEHQKHFTPPSGEVYSAETIFTEVLADMKMIRNRSLFDYNSTMLIHEAQRRLLNTGFRALDVMLSFGNQAQPIETATVEKRFEAIKEKVNASVS